MTATCVLAGTPRVAAGPARIQGQQTRTDSVGIPPAVALAIDLLSNRTSGLDRLSRQFRFFYAPQLSRRIRGPAKERAPVLAGAL